MFQQIHQRRKKKWAFPSLKRTHVPKDPAVPTGTSQPITRLHLSLVLHADQLHVLFRHIYKSPVCSSPNEILQKQSLKSFHCASATRQTMIAYRNWRTPTNSKPLLFYFLPIDISHWEASFTAGNRNVPETLATPVFRLDRAGEQTGSAKINEHTLQIWTYTSKQPSNGEEGLTTFSWLFSRTISMR